MLKGIAKLIDVYGDSLNDDIFKEKLGSVSAKEISRTAKERKSGTMGYAEAMVTVYNRKMKAGLKWGKLYNSSDGVAGGGVGSNTGCSGINGDESTGGSTSGSGSEVNDSAESGDRRSSCESEVNDSAAGENRTETA